MTATKTRLAAELRAVAAKASPANAATYDALACRAETGEFDDFSDVHVCGPTALYWELTRAGFTKFAARVREGEFDASAEESEAWARSQTDPQIIGIMDALRAELAAERAKVEAMGQVIAEGCRAIGDHFAPHDCYATGPSTGDPLLDLVQCPACSFIAMNDALTATKGATK